MDDVTRNRIESFDDRKAWFDDHTTVVDTNLKLKNLRDTEIFPKLIALHGETGTHAGAESEGEEQTDVKDVSRETGIAIARKVSIAAEAAEIEQPGIQARYPRPRGLSFEDLVNLLRGFVIGGNTDEDILKDYGAPADWVAQCTAAANAIEAAGLTQASAQEQRIGSRAAYLVITDDLMQLFRTADAIIQNLCADDPAALASWKSAMHVKSPPKKKKPTP